ncbi:Piso0_000664 [Millerozyma farinosa CBS 7064]|uniref:Piso0_000664 protein n=1 Tax=Pichia sorbitophila (strain ATCC MYA-4447 / BCRC 22081 / CBS 7064 / NBRC 10061 / NRRL Y-12695) TaxID=559304 RepID=G8YR64_PICSO|nr:Piso0_000664 [Millerozyma farinosa CBS 7064]
MMSKNRQIVGSFGSSTKAISRNVFTYRVGNINRSYSSDDKQKDKNLSSKEHDEENILIADALNLLSPRVERRISFDYKPSLLQSLRSTTDDKHEEVKNFMHYEMPKTDTKKHLNNLISGLSALSQVPKASNLKHISVIECSPSEIRNFIKGETREDSVLEVMRLLYYRNNLNFQVAIDILLHRSVKDLSKLPFNIKDITSDSLKGWKRENIIQFHILLMKKYHDLRQPEKIIENLQENFWQEYLPMIKMSKLGPFYERIVWKFYFEHLNEMDSHGQLGEEYFIRHLNSLKSSFLIWESSLQRSSGIAQEALKFHQSILNPFQQTFLALCSNPICRSIIGQEIEDSIARNSGAKSKTLSRLKKLSHKYKIYGLSNLSSKTSLADKAALYSFIREMESEILDILVSNQSILNPQDQASLTLLLKDLRSIRDANLKNANPETREDGIMRDFSHWNKSLWVMNK